MKIKISLLIGVLACLSAFFAAPALAAPKIMVKPTNDVLKLGSARKIVGTVTYKNEGPGSWSPKAEYTVLEGKPETVEIKDGCTGKIVKEGEECSVTLTRQVAERERYKAELKFGSEAPTVVIEAEGPLITVSPTNDILKLGNSKKTTGIVTYTNKGTESWSVPNINYTILEGKGKTVEIKDGCKETIVPSGGKCTVTVVRDVVERERYKADLNFGSVAPTALIEAEGPLITVSPVGVKFGNSMKAEETFEYTNMGDEGWEAPESKIVVKEGTKAKLIVGKNSCKKENIPVDEKCSIEIIYEVVAPENYLAELELGIAPVALVEAEEF
jgi:hypothetical protein